MPGVELCFLRENKTYGINHPLFNYSLGEPARSDRAKGEKKPAA